MDAGQIVLSNGTLRCVVALRGAELRSLFDHEARDEYIWQRDPAVWADSAPILFPVVGRVKDGSYLHEGRRYPMPIHGFARHCDFAPCEPHPHGVTLVLRDSPETRAVYPFRFVLRVRFALEPHSLRVSYRVTNPDTQPMHFSLGSHPGFRLPPTPRGASDWSLAFSDEEAAQCYRLDGALLARQPEPLVLAHGRRIALSPELFARDALIFKQIRSRHVRLLHRNGRVRLSVATGGAPSLGLWARPGASYVCIEPWHGYDDDAGASGELAGKAGIVTLAPAATFHTEYIISVPPAPLP